MIALRPAALDDLPLLQAWLARPHVRAAFGDSGAPDWDFDNAIREDWREALIAEDAGRPVGYVEIIDPARDPEGYWGAAAPSFRAIDIWIGEAADLGRGFGTQMMALALARCFAAPAVDAVLIDPLASNTRAIAFYERCGFVREDIRAFDDDICQVMRHTRADWRRSLSSARNRKGPS